MIIHFDLDIDDLSKLSDEVIGEAIHQLCHSSSQGYHLIVISRTLSAYLLGKNVSAFEKAVLTRISNNYTQFGGLLEERIRYIRVCGDHAKHRNFSIPVSIDFLLDGAFSRPTQVVVENKRRDGGIYRIIVEAHAKKFRLPCVELELIHGGGGDVEESVLGLIGNSGIYVALSDSDRKSPFDEGNQKVARITLSMKPASTAICSAYETPTHELENFFTIAELEKIEQWNSNQSRGVYASIFEEWKAGSCDLYQFIDLKIGVGRSKEKISGKAADWIDDKKKKYKIIEIAGFGDKIPMSILESDEAQAAFHRTMREKYWCRTFGIFCFTVLEWVIADRKFRAA